MAETGTQLRPIRFGNFEVDLRAGELRRAGVKLKFGGQPFQVLTDFAGASRRSSDAGRVTEATLARHFSSMSITI